MVLQTRLVVGWEENKKHIVSDAGSPGIDPGSHMMGTVMRINTQSVSAMRDPLGSHLINPPGSTGDPIQSAWSY